MTTLRIKSVLRMIGRVALLILLGYPYVIVVVPMAVWLGVHLFGSLIAQAQPYSWSRVEVVRGVGMTIAVALFATLTLSYLIATVYAGWKGSRDIYARGSWDLLHRPWLHDVITRESLLNRISALQKTHTLIGPVARAEPRCDPAWKYLYDRVPHADNIALDFDFTVYSPKATLLPPHETLFQFDKNRQRFQELELPDRAVSTAIVGVHPCDIHAIRLLDDVFARDHADQPYLRRREKTFIVGIDCPEPCTPGVFCRDLKTNRAHDGFDVMLYPLPPVDNLSNGRRETEAYGVVYGTVEGRRWLTECAPAAVRTPTVSDERRFEELLRHKAECFPRNLIPDAHELPLNILNGYDSLVWEATAQRCYSCGSCNLVCPTCYCFDIQDRTDLPTTRGERYRTWDSCMLRDFAVVAGNHNFRSKKGERLRHRIARKAAWIERRTGLSGCVGCGRCTRACTAHISIVEILNQLANERAGAKREPAAAALVAARG